MLRAHPELAGPVASDPVISRLVSTLAADAPRALRVIRTARAAARERAWSLAGDAAPGGDGGLIVVDLDATIVTAHSERTGCADVEEDVRFPPAGRVRRPRHRRRRRSAGHQAAAGQRRIEHGS
jgi:hypothetical protein